MNYSDPKKVSISSTLKLGSRNRWIKTLLNKIYIIKYELECIVEIRLNAQLPIIIRPFEGSYPAEWRGVNGFSACKGGREYRGLLLKAHLAGASRGVVGGRAGRIVSGRGCAAVVLRGHILRRGGGGTFARVVRTQSAGILGIKNKILFKHM